MGAGPGLGATHPQTVHAASVQAEEVIRSLVNDSVQSGASPHFEALLAQECTLAVDSVHHATGVRHTAAALAALSLARTAHECSHVANHVVHIRHGNK